MNNVLKGIGISLAAVAGAVIVTVAVRELNKSPWCIEE